MNFPVLSILLPLPLSPLLHSLLRRERERQPNNGGEKRVGGKEEKGEGAFYEFFTLSLLPPFLSLLSQVDKGTQIGLHYLQNMLFLSLSLLNKMSISRGQGVVVWEGAGGG